MASGAFLYVLLAVVTKFDRDALWRIVKRQGLFCKLMTAAAVRARGLLRLPVTVETRSMIAWRSLERGCVRGKIVHPAGCRRHRGIHPGSVANFAVIVSLGLVVGCVCKRGERDLYKDRGRIELILLPGARNHILMLVMWKLDPKLRRAVRLTKAETSFVARRDFCVTVRADDGTWTFEKLSTMTADTCIVIRIVSYVGKLSDFLPIPARNLMAGIAFSLVFSSSMGKLRVVDAAAWLSRRSGSSAGIALLCHRVAVRGQQPAESDHSTERRKQTVKGSNRIFGSALTHWKKKRLSFTC